MRNTPLLEKIGHTPLRLLEGVYVKLECSNPGGSVKDRMAKFLLQEAIRRGELHPDDTVVEATSGNTGIALTMVARELGFPVLILMPEHMSEERRRMMEAMGAEVRLTPEEGGFELPIEIRDTYRGRPGYFVPDQFANPDNTLCHRRTTGPEILTQLAELGCKRLDAFVAGVGTGGSLMGTGQALKESFPDLRIVAVEPAESNVMSGGCSGTHGIMGIGDGFIPELVDMGFVDEVACVSTAEAREAANAIRSRYGFCVGLSAGANLVAAGRQRDQGRVAATLWPDCSDRYVSVGLEPPSSREVNCPLKAACSARTRELLEN